VVTSDTSAITLALQGGTPGAMLGGVKTVNAVAGVATFSLNVDRVGSGYSLHASDASLTPDDSSTFAITPGAAAKLAFTSQPPASSTAGVNFGASVTVQDSAGNTVTGDGSAVSLSLTCGCATLDGATAVVVSSGVATFSSLRLSKAGSGYHLSAADSNGGIATDTSAAFAVVAAAASQLQFSTQPANVAQGHALNAIAATEKDQFGNVKSSDSSSSVSFTVPACGGTLSLGNATMASGVATLGSAQRFYTSASGLRVTAQAAPSGLNVASQNVAVTDPALDFIFADGLEACRL